MAAIDEFDTYILPDNQVCGAQLTLGSTLMIFIFQNNNLMIKNKLVEAIEVFAEIQNNPCLKHKTFIIFLNKVDVFKDKILTTNIIDHFADFPGRQHNKRQLAAVTDW